MIEGTCGKIRTGSDQCRQQQEQNQPAHTHDALPSESSTRSLSRRSTSHPFQNPSSTENPEQASGDVQPDRASLVPRHSGIQGILGVFRHTKWHGAPRNLFVSIYRVGHALDSVHYRDAFWKPQLKVCGKELLVDCDLFEFHAIPISRDALVGRPLLNLLREKNSRLHFPKAEHIPLDPERTISGPT